MAQYIISRLTSAANGIPYGLEFIFTPEKLDDNYLTKITWQLNFWCTQDSNWHFTYYNHVKITVNNIILFDGDPNRVELHGTEKTTICSGESTIQLNTDNYTSLNIFANYSQEQQSYPYLQTISVSGTPSLADEYILESHEKYAVYGHDRESVQTFIALPDATNTYYFNQDMSNTLALAAYWIDFQNLPISWDKVENISNICNYASITKPYYFGQNIIDMSFAYRYCSRLTSTHIIPYGDKVQNMAYCYQNCTNLTIANYPIAASTINACGLYYGCNKIVSAISFNADNLVDMSYMFGGCNKLKTTPVCGENTQFYSGVYSNCQNLTGFPVCGNKVEMFGSAYSNCVNLSGAPVCGNNVRTMQSTYANCRKLTGAPVCGPKVENMYATYANCINLTGNLYMYSNLVTNTSNMLYGHNKLNTINIYTYADSITNKSLYTNKVYQYQSWTMDATNNRYYDATNNIYVYYNWDGTNYDALS